MLSPGGGAAGRRRVGLELGGEPAHPISLRCHARPWLREGVEPPQSCLAVLSGERVLPGVFQPCSLWIVWAGNFFDAGVVLSIMGYLAASLVGTLQMPIAIPSNYNNPQWLWLGQLVQSRVPSISLCCITWAGLPFSHPGSWDTGVQ